MSVSEATVVLVVLNLCWLVVNEFTDELLSRAPSGWAGGISVGQRG